jgi:hypothetical protein
MEREYWKETKLAQRGYCVREEQAEYKIDSDYEYDGDNEWRKYEIQRSFIPSAGRGCQPDFSGGLFVSA